MTTEKNEGVKEECKDHYLFLEDIIAELREARATNMFGVVPYLQKELGMSREEFYTVLSDWMNNYSDISKK